MVGDQYPGQSYPAQGYPVQAGGVDGSVTVSGLSAAYALGVAIAIGSALIGATGIASASSLGTTTVIGAATITVSGVSSTATVGAGAESASATVGVSGVASSSAVGVLVSTGAAQSSVSGISAASAVGTSTDSGSASLIASGVSAVMAVGAALAAGPVMNQIGLMTIAAFVAVGPFRSSHRRRGAPGSTVLPTPSVPEIPNSPTPDPGGTKVYGAIRWVAAGATKFDVYLDTNPVPVTLVSWHQVDSFFVPTVVPKTTYYWQVIAINDGGQTPGPVWSFTVPSGTSVIISINGVVATNRARGGSLTIQDVLGATPNIGAAIFTED